MINFFIGLLIGFILPLPNYIFMKSYIKQLDEEILELCQMLDEKEI